MVSPMSLIKTKAWEYCGLPYKVVEIDEAYNPQTKSYRKYLKIENLKTGEIGELPLEALNDSRELDKSKLEQLSQSDQPIPSDSGRGQKHCQRGVKVGDPINTDPVKGSDLTMYGLRHFRP